MQSNNQLDMQVFSLSRNLFKHIYILFDYFLVPIEIVKKLHYVIEDGSILLNL